MHEYTVQNIKTKSLYFNFDENALRCNLRAPIFQNFPGGHAPRPLVGAYYAC